MSRRCSQYFSAALALSLFIWPPFATEAAKLLSASIPQL